jgi:hypothetical protein
MSYLDKLKLITAPADKPELSDDDLGECLAATSLTDAAGNAPTSGSWSPTYDLNAAAARAWLMKAARAAATTEVEGTDPAVVTSKVFDNCRAMARIYAAKGTATISVR